MNLLKPSIIATFAAGLMACTSAATSGSAPATPTPSLTPTPESPGWGMVCPGPDVVGHALGLNPSSASPDPNAAGGVTCLYSVPSPSNPGEVLILFATDENFNSFVNGIKADLSGLTLTFTNVSGVGSNAVLLQNRSQGIVGIIAELDSRDVYIFAGVQVPPTAAQVEALARQLLQPPA